MRNYLREAIREEIRHELRDVARYDGAERPGGSEDGQHRQNGQSGHSEQNGHQATAAQFRVVLRPVASSLPLGFFAFAVGTVLLSAGWVATAISLRLGPPGALSLPLAIFLLMLALVMLTMAAPSMTGKPLFGLLLVIGAVRFALTGVYQAYGYAGVERSAGWIGVPLAVFARYGGLALLLEESYQRMVLPLGRRGRARSSLEGGFGRQVQQAELEPGVRRQL